MKRFLVAVLFGLSFQGKALEVVAPNEATSEVEKKQARILLIAEPVQGRWLRNLLQRNGYNQSHDQIRLEKPCWGHECLLHQGGRDILVIIESPRRLKMPNWESGSWSTMDFLSALATDPSQSRVKRIIIVRKGLIANPIVQSHINQKLHELRLDEQNAKTLSPLWQRADVDQFINQVQHFTHELYQNTPVSQKARLCDGTLFATY